MKLNILAFKYNNIYIYILYLILDGKYFEQGTLHVAMTIDLILKEVVEANNLEFNFVSYDINSNKNQSLY